MNRMIPPVLTIAGSDSGGGAGIQADLRTFHAFGVYGCSVITAVTAQNPDEVRRVDVLDPGAVKAQLEAVLAPMTVRFAKTGMLANKEIIECVAEQVQSCNLFLTVDPVMVSTSGVRLLEESAISAMQEKLFPLAEWITPNIPEAELLCRRKLTSVSDLAEAACFFYERYKCNCLLKSGHFIHSEEVTDIVCYQGAVYSLRSPVVPVKKHTAHGTGCTLSAALAANSALGNSWQETLISSKAFVYGSLYESADINGTLSQMYPPKENYCKKVSLERL